MATRNYHQPLQPKPPAYFSDEIGRKDDSERFHGFQSEFPVFVDPIRKDNHYRSLTENLLFLAGEIAKI